MLFSTIGLQKVKIFQSSITESLSLWTVAQVLNNLHYLYYLSDEDAGSRQTWAAFRIRQSAGFFWL